MRIILVSLLVMSFAWAQEKQEEKPTETQAEKKLRLSQSKQLKLTYQFNSWNKNPKAEDSGSLLLRDGETGKLARVELQETGPNTGEFVGYYSISFGGQDVAPEVYIPPQDMVKSTEKLKALDLLIKDGLLLRKPFFLRPEKSYQAITVFDSKDQALQAYERFRNTAKGKPIVSPSAIEAQQKAALSAEQKRLADLAQKQEMERIKLAEEERLRQEELKRQQQQLSENEKKRRKAEASQLAEQAMQAYQKNDYNTAEALFKKSQELDPENTTYNFQYGVTLYRNQKYNQSIVTLGLAKDLTPEQSLQKNFFTGMNYMKLKEFDTAHDLFDKVKAANDKSLSPSASFFNGVMDFQKEKYDTSKAYFEYVLDNSSDPKLDEQAETYIEQIAQIKQFEANKAKKFLFSANVGVTYDSNVLLTQDGGEPSSESGTEGIRMSYGLTGEYRPLYNEKHEFSAVLAYSDIYTKTKSFGDDAVFTDADPNVISLSTPYKYKGKLWNKGYQGTFTAGYDTTYMNADNSGGRELITTSGYFKNDNTFIMSEDWFSTYSLELRSESSKIEVSDSDDDTSASRVTLSTSQIFFEDKKKTEGKIYDGAITLNNATGDNYKYTKIALGFSKLLPWKWETSVVGRLDASYATYPSSSASRKDTSYGVTTSITKPFKEKWSILGSFNYTVNDSTDETNKYSKYTLSTLLSYSL